MAVNGSSGLEAMRLNVLFQPMCLMLGDSGIQSFWLYDEVGVLGA